MRLFCGGVRVRNIIEQRRVPWLIQFWVHMLYPENIARFNDLIVWGTNVEKARYSDFDGISQRSTRHGKFYTVRIATVHSACFIRRCA